MKSQPTLIFRSALALLILAVCPVQAKKNQSPGNSKQPQVDSAFKKMEDGSEVKDVIIPVTDGSPMFGCLRKIP